MTRFTTYVPAELPELTLPRPEEMAQAAQIAGGVHGARFFRAQMTQPAYSQIIFRGSQGQYEVDDQWTGIWTPMSIKLVNPYAFPIYVAANGDPTGNGFPFPPEATLRVPFAGQGGSFVLAVNESDLTDNDAIVHLFRYATPE